jgi:acetolactate synthase I/II/III large subunit
LDDCSVDGTPVRSPLTTVLRVDHDPNSIGALKDTFIRADAGMFATALAREWSTLGHRNAQLTERVRTLKLGSPTFEDTAKDDVLSPARALRDLETTFGRNARYVSDIGEHMLFALHYLNIEQGSFSLHLPFGSMGSGICGAIGESMKGETVVCICGDGGMQMNGMEVLVAAQRSLPVIFAVFNDARYGMVYHGFKHAYGRDVPWETPWVDFVTWARSMDIPALRITHPGQLTATAVERARIKPGPMILDMRIERSMPFPMTSRNDALRRLSMQATTPS